MAQDQPASESSSATATRLEFESADFVALMIGVQDWRRWNFGDFELPPSLLGWLFESQ